MLVRAKRMEPTNTATPDKAGAREERNARVQITAVEIFIVGNNLDGEDLGPEDILDTVLPSPESATEVPCWAPPTAPVPISLGLCWLNVCAQEGEKESGQSRHNKEDSAKVMSSHRIKACKPFHRCYSVIPPA
jgi:hypothetical protein